VCMPLEALTGGFSGVSNPMNMAPFGQQYDYSIYLSHVHLFFPFYGGSTDEVNVNMVQQTKLIYNVEMDGVGL
jgi:hypothetical protein